MGAADASATVKYWIGTGGDSFNDNAKWSTTTGGVNDTTAPGSSDIATFDANGNTNVALDTTVNVDGIDINSGYTATLTQSASVTVTVGDADYDQADGIFAGSDAAIDIDGRFIQTGGTFTATTGTMSWGTINESVADNMTLTGGTFNHNGGTVVIEGNCGSHNCKTFDVDTTLTLNNLTMSNGGNFSVTITSGDTIVVEGDYIASNDVHTGILELQGNVTATTGSQGTALVNFTGTNNQVVDLTGALGIFNGNITVNKPSGVVRFDSDATFDGSGQTFDITSGEVEANGTNINITGAAITIAASGTFTAGTGTHLLRQLSSSGTFNGDSSDITVVNGSLVIGGGTFTAPSGTLSIIDNFTHTSGATFVHNGGTLDFSGNSGGRTIDVTASETFGSMIFNDSGGWTATVASNDILILTGDLTFTKGPVNTSGTSNIRVDGNVTVGSTAGNSTIPITFTGSGNSSFTLDATKIGVLNGDISVDKTGGDVTLMSALTMDAGGQDLTLVEGRFNVNGQTLSVVGTLSVESGGDYAMTGDESAPAPTLASGSIVTYTATSGSRVIQDYNYSLSTLGFDGVGGTFLMTVGGETVNNLTITNGIFDLNGQILTVSTTFSNNGTLKLEGGEATVSLTNDTDSGTIYYKGDGSTPYTGLKAGNDYFNLTFDNAGNSWNLNAALDVDGDFAITNGDVQTGTNNVNVAGNWTVAAAYTAGSNTTTFDGTSGTQTVITGGTGDNFDFNNVVINNSGTWVQISTNSMDIDGSLTITAGTLDMNTFNLAAATFSNNGTLRLQGGETATLANDTDSGLIFYSGDGATAYTSLAVGDYYFDVEFDSGANTWTLNAAMDINGDLDIANGSLITGGFGITLAGNFTNAATFTHGSGAVTLDGTGQSIIGATTFYNLSKTVSSADTLTFTATETHAIDNNLTLQGAAGQLLSLVTTSGGSAVNLAAAGTVTTQYLSVQDINNTGSTIQCTSGCTDVSGNTGWNFVAAGGGGTPTPGTGPAAAVTSATLMSPNGGEILQGNSMYNITWSASGDSLDTISLHYSKDNGQTYSLIAANEPNDGSYSWTVPNETAVTGKIRVDAVTSTGGVLIDDSSNASFSITSITVVPEPEITEPEQTGPVLAEMLSPTGEVLEIREGSLFRGVELSGVYQVVDGTRYVFPNEETFLSYFADFSGVQQVNDDQLRAIKFGGRMIMNVGQLIKIQSDNRVYVVLEGGVLQHIPDEETAISTYGADWAQLVHDISVVFWFDYTHS